MNSTHTTEAIADAAMIAIARSTKASGSGCMMSGLMAQLAEATDGVTIDPSYAARGER